MAISITSASIALLLAPAAVWVGAVTEIPAATVLARSGAALQRTYPDATLTDLRRLPGGVSSLTYAATIVRGPVAEAVIKVAPAGLPAVRNRDVLRQARMMRALAAIPGVPVPWVLGEDDGDPPLFVMERITGECYEPGTDITTLPPAPTDVRARMRAAAEALARMQAMTPAALGIPPEEPTFTPEAELRRWARLLETVGPEIAAGHERLRDRLAEHPPAPGDPAVLHGTTASATCSSPVRSCARSSTGRSGRWATPGTTSPGCSLVYLPCVSDRLIADAPVVPPGHRPARSTRWMSSMRSAGSGGYPGRTDRRQG
ncbi:MAG: phosphotransferase [Tetrasphaera sp.]